jgi:hypothetical protein
VERTEAPLPLEDYFSPFMNRYGRGMTACLYFGRKVEVVSRVEHANKVSVCSNMDRRSLDGQAS